MLKKVRGFYMELVYNPGRCCGFFNILCRVIFLNNYMVVWKELCNLIGSTHN
jgi:hypothetical protein